MCLSFCSPVVALMSTLPTSPPARSCRMRSRTDFRTTMVFADKERESLGDGLTRSRIEPGGRAGPNRETRSDVPGGLVWNDIWFLGSPSDAIQTIIPDIRLPPNQYWPL